MIQVDRQKQLLLSVKKAQWMLTKITKMIEEDIYCADIAQQVSATIGLLKGTNTVLLRNHLLCCGVRQLASKDPEHVEKFVEELLRTWDVSTRK